MRLQSRILLLSIGFAIAVTLYFAGRHLGFEGQLANDVVKTLPLCLLTILTWTLSPRRLAIMPMAFLFSALGDLAGEHRNFILQIGMFAVAHLLFTTYFVRRAKFDTIAYISSAIIVTTAIGLAAKIVPNIERATEQWACLLYILLISIMAISTTAQQRYRLWYMLAAVTFMFSDSCIAWNRFVERIPYAGVVIMASYFVAQYIFAVTYLAEHSDQSASK